MGAVRFGHVQDDASGWGLGPHAQLLGRPHTFHSQQPPGESKAGRHSAGVCTSKSRGDPATLPPQKCGTHQTSVGRPYLIKSWLQGRGGRGGHVAEEKEAPSEREKRREATAR